MTNCAVHNRILFSVIQVKMYFISLATYCTDKEHIHCYKYKDFCMHQILWIAVRSIFCIFNCVQMMKFFTFFTLFYTLICLKYYGSCGRSLMTKQQKLKALYCTSASTENHTQYKDFDMLTTYTVLLLITHGL